MYANIPCNCHQRKKTRRKWDKSYQNYEEEEVEIPNLNSFTSDYQGPNVKLEIYVGLTYNLTSMLNILNYFIKNYDQIEFKKKRMRLNFLKSKK